MPVLPLILLDLRPTPRPSAWQMACDEVLLTTVTQPVLRVYAWSEPTWTFGYFQRYQTVRDQLGAGADLQLMRRWTGGGMVDHRSDLPYSLIIPHQHPWAKLTAKESYQFIHQALTRAFHQQGLPAQLQTAEQARGNACFQSPVVADVMCGGMKIAGAAQRRTRDGMLHQGSIQLPHAALATVDAHLLCQDFIAGLGGSVEQGAIDPATAGSILTFAKVLAAQNVEGEVTRPAPSPEDAALRGAGLLTSPSTGGSELMEMSIAQLSVTKYSTPAWLTFR